MIKGFATPEGTAAYKERFKKLEGHFRSKQGLFFSSVGMGSYLGESDDATDRLYEEALKEALLSGVNVVDSAANYRCQRSERAFGHALAELIASGKIKREEIILCTKGGFIPFDGAFPEDPERYFHQTFVENGILSPHELVQGCHAMTPAYLENQLEQSLANLGVETIDIYYIHNPETQLEEIERPEFMKRLSAAFEMLEEKVKEGKIRMYGTATWNGYRIDPEAPGYLSVEEIVCAAREVAGPAHHFKAVQLPLNLAMPEAWVFANQAYGANWVPFLSMAERFDLVVAASASLLQSKLCGKLPDFIYERMKHYKKSSQCSLQFTRSVPGVTTALVGMKTKAHVAENLETAKFPPMNEQALVLMFQQDQQGEQPE